MRNLFILIEGPDNCGKTTLINNLKNHYSDYTLHALHYSNVKQPTPEKTIEFSTKLYTQMFSIMQNLSTKYKTGVICDRSHLGEMVYGPIYRGYTGDYVLDIEKKNKINISFWDSLFLITLRDSAERLIERDDGLSFSTDLDKKNTEINNFINAHNQSLIKHKLLLDIETHDAEQALDAAVKFIEGKRND